MRRPPARAALRLALLSTVIAALAAGCGSDGGDTTSSAPRQLTVALDFTPNPVHAPIYTAVRDGLDRRNGLRIVIQRPGSQPDSLKALLTGRADIGILDIQDLGIARTKGEDVVAIGALVDRPLAALIAQPTIKRPRDLQGGRVGVSGLPSDPAFLNAIVRADGGDPSTIHQITIGFNAVSALLTRKVDAVPAFWSVEGVALRAKGRPIREFHPEDYGAPPYPEVVLLTTGRMLRRHRDAVERFLTTVRQGAAATLRDPEASVRQIAKAAGDADPAAVRAQLRALRPVLDPSLGLDRAVLRRWSVFAARIGILPRPIDVDRAFAFDLAAH